MQVGQEAGDRLYTRGRYRAYSEYRDSGVEWLAAVPAHWEVRRLKQAFQRIVGGSTPAGDDERYWDGDIVWVTPADVSQTDRLSTSFRKITIEGLRSCSAELVDAGSIVVTSRAPVGNVAVAEVPLCTNQGCKALVASRGSVDPRFGFSVLRTLAHELQSLATGTTFREISTSKLGTAPMPLPPLPEQHAIAAFLDRETDKIDRLIAKKERLIELLSEQRTALITHAVTKGLDPDVPMKDSGVEWLGEVPEHWAVLGSKRIFRHRKEQARPDDQQLTASQKYGVLLQSDFMTREQQRVVQVVTGEDILKHVEPNDFVISMRSFQGGIELSRVGGRISSAYQILAASRPIDHEYFSVLLKSHRYIQALQSTSDLVRDGQALRFANFAQVALPLPPLAEQRQIAAHVQTETARNNVLAVTCERMIDRLREYRSALISAAVTGKIDVRDEVAA